MKSASSENQREIKVLHFLIFSTIIFTLSRWGFFSRCARWAFMSSELAHSSLKNDGSVYLFKHAPAAPAAPATSNLERIQSIYTLKTKTHFTKDHQPSSSSSKRLIGFLSIKNSTLFGWVSEGCFFAART